MAESTKLEENMKDIIWECVGFNPLDELFSYVRHKLPKQAGIVNPEKLENFIRNYITELTINEDGFVRPNLPQESLWHATYAFRVPNILTKGLELLAGSEDGYELDQGHLMPVIQYPGIFPVKDPLANEKCVYGAVAPEHAIFKRGISKGIAVLEIDPSNNKFIPVDTHGSPLIDDEENIRKQFDFGTIDLGTYTPIHPDRIKRAYIHENDKDQLITTSDPRIVSVSPKSPKQWNRVIAEHYAMTKG